MTDTKTTPLVDINTVTPTQESVTFNIDVTDTDNAGSITAVELYHEGVLLEEITDFEELYFENLLLYTEYTIKVIYDFDLNDGVGMQGDTEIFEFKTLLYTEGDGTKENPYLLTTPEDFDYIDLYSHAHYILGNNIDFTGTSFRPISEFYGTFDGKGHTLSNISSTYDELDGVNYHGVFEINHGHIANILIKNMNVSTSSYLNTYVGLLVGENQGLIENVHTTGKISVVSHMNNVYAGGIVGYNRGGNILKSGSNVLIDAEAYVSSNVGGIVGKVGLYHNALIDQVYANVEIHNKGEETYSGGLIGNVNIRGSYSVKLSNFQVYGYIFDNGTTRNASGGAIGRAYPNNSGELKIYNGYASVDIVSTRTGWYSYSGGLVGEIIATYNAMFDMRNVISLGNVELLENCGSCDVGSVIGHLNSSGAQAVLINNYRLAEQVLIIENESVESYDKALNGISSKSMDDLLIGKFYTNNLFWDKDVWIILDEYAFNIYPQLRVLE